MNATSGRMSLDPQKTWAMIVLTRSTGAVSWVYNERLVPGLRCSALGWLGHLRRRLVRYRRWRNSSTRFVLIWSWLRLVFPSVAMSYGCYGNPLSPFLSMWGGVKAAGWSAWWWQSHTDLKNCKRQFRGFLRNWRFPSFRPVDWMFCGFLSIFVIETITIVMTFVVRTVS